MDNNAQKLIVGKIRSGNYENLDEIASALYNAGKTSIQDVADFLNKQTGFQNSTENERKNTIASVWKRL